MAKNTLDFNEERKNLKYKYTILAQMHAIIEKANKIRQNQSCDNTFVEIKVLDIVKKADRNNYLKKYYFIKNICNKAGIFIELEEHEEKENYIEFYRLFTFSSEKLKCDSEGHLKELTYLYQISQLLKLTSKSLLESYPESDKSIMRRLKLIFSDQKENF